MPAKLTVVISEGRGADPAQERLARQLAAMLADRPEVDIALLPHLYDLVPGGPSMEYLRSLEGDLIVLSQLYPRAAFWVLDANGVGGRMKHTSLSAEDEPSSSSKTGPAPERTIWCLDLRGSDDPAAYVNEIDRIVRRSGLGVSKAPAAHPRRIEETSPERWYPVIDYGRCNGCLECLNFCLFGVYDLDQADRILVAEPDACRSGCPACSRICPASAIMFPPHRDPAIAGDHHSAPGELKLDLSQLFGGSTAAELAAAERDRALAEPNGAMKPPADDELDRLVDGLDELP